MVGCRRFGARLRIEVWDSGPGIPKDQFQEIFREFVQQRNAGLARQDGLTLVKEIRQTVREPVPAILISGEPDLPRMAAVAESGLPVLRKPVSGAALLLELRRLLADAA